MGEEQIWAQLELRSQNICQILAQALDGAGQDEDADRIGEGSKKLRLEDTNEGGDEGEEISAYANKMNGEDGEDSDDEEEEEEDYDSEDDGVDLGENVQALRDPSSEEEDEGKDAKRLELRNSKILIPKPRRGGHPDLDDGFFDLAEFNAETERAEAKSSSKGHLGDDNDNDEEEDDDSLDLFASMDGPAILDENDLESSGGTSRSILSFVCMSCSRT